MERYFCADCGALIENEKAMITAQDGKTFCNEECAKRKGYIQCEACGGWTDDWINTTDDRCFCSKVCAKTIRVGARMDIASLVKASVEYTMFKCDGSRSKHTTGDYSVASATGDYSVASATGDWSVASATGRRGAASATGDWSVASATGFRGVASATGCRGAASANNPTAIAVAWGPFGRAKGVLGAHIVCAEWRNGKLVDAKMAVVDGNKIKADKYYMLKNGEFAEVKQ